MKYGTTYYKLWNQNYDAVAALYRIRRTADELFIERWHPILGAWTEGPPTFGRFVYEGDDGADEISEGEVFHLIASGSLPPLPKLQPWER
jgi:hypothetical protein